MTIIIEVFVVIGLSLGNHRIAIGNLDGVLLVIPLIIG
jgi:hypothetical protein